jgi:hypothetical protein
VSQPTDRLLDHQPLGELDEERGEFWIKNPWTMNHDPRNVSAYEPNQVFLNLGSGTFAEIGHLTTANSDGDGRGAAVLDVNGDLQPDLVLRQSGGGAVVVIENRFPPVSRLEVSLAGTESNSLGIGARVIAVVGERRIHRDLYPENNYHVSQGALVRFGLGDAQQVDKLIVHWPSGTVQELGPLPVNAHVRVTEGKDDFEVVLRAKQVTEGQVGQRSETSGTSG